MKNRLFIQSPPTSVYRQSSRRLPARIDESDSRTAHKTEILRILSWVWRLASGVVTVNRLARAFGHDVPWCLKQFFCLGLHERRHEQEDARVRIPRPHEIGFVPKDLRCVRERRPK